MSNKDVQLHLSHIFSNIFIIELLWENTFLCEMSERNLELFRTSTMELFARIVTYFKP